MTLLERYLRAVRFFLPRKHQDDIVRELYENISSDLEERAGALGRALHEAEVADILRRHGHPVIVAARYGPRQQLISPVVFPIYVLALKLGLGAALAVTVIVAVIGAAWRGGSVPYFVDAMLAYPNRALIVFAWTTIGFAVLDLANSRTQLKPDWDPRKIPDWMVGPGRPARLHDRAHAVVEVVFGILGLGWLLLVPTSPWLAMGPLAAVLDFAPVWGTWYVPLVAVAAANLSLDVYGLVRPTPTVRRITLELSVLACQLLVVLTILSARVWVVAVPGAALDGVPPDKLPELLTWVNTGVAIGLGSVIVITVIEMGKQYYRLRTLKGGSTLTGAAEQRQ
jgi:hypothetical protein